MMQASGATAEFRVDAIPLLSEARRLAGRGIAPDGSRLNVRNLKPRTQVGAGVSEEDLLLLCDAQTSGGLLVALPASEAAAYAEACAARGANAARIVGVVQPAGPLPLRVVKSAQRV